MTGPEEVGKARGFWKQGPSPGVLESLRPVHSSYAGILRLGAIETHISKPPEKSFIRCNIHEIIFENPFGVS